jgi:hypothetical protein
MFDLDRAITEWRRQLGAGALQAPELLDELESHLRDDIEEQVRSGSQAQSAFAAAVARIGKAAALQSEFGKIGVTKKIAERVKGAVLTLAGIPNQYQTKLMNESNSMIEPRWATYIRGGAFLLPATSLWAFSTLFLFPKVREICRDAGLAVPSFFRIMIAMMEFLQDHGVLFLGAIVLMLALAEWRSGKWPRYRRTSIGVGVFVVNSAVLVLITAMFTLAMMAAPALFHAK